MYQMYDMSDELHDRVPDTQASYGMLHCDLCYDREIKKHTPWNCDKYNTPQKVRERYTDSGRCIACGVERWAHKEECNISYILSQNKSEHCKQCRATDHLFWTCDGEPHPGSQFNKSMKGIVSSKSNKSNCNQKSDLTIRQNLKELKKAAKLENPTLKKEKYIEINKEKVTEVLESSYIFTKIISNSGNEICIQRKKEFETDHLDKVASYNILSKNSAELKSIREKDESLTIKENVLIKEQNYQIKNLKFEQEKQNNLYCNKSSECQSKISDLNNKLKEKSEESDLVMNLRKRVEFYKEKIKQNYIEKEKFMEEYQKESNKFMELLSIIFPKVTIDKNLDNISFIKIFENKVKNTGCESTACQKRIQETAKARDKEISILKEKFSNLKSKMTVSESDLLNSQENLINVRAHTESLYHKINYNNEIIHQKDKAIESLQLSLQQEIQKEENIKLQKVNQNVSINTKQEEKSENKDSISTEENRLRNDSEIISSNIEKILLEVSNEKRIATEKRIYLHNKMNALSTNLERAMNRKLIRYRGERGSQIASFEERIKREFSNMMSSANYEEIRLLENKNKQDKQDVNHRIKKLEELHDERHREMTENINEIKDSNKELKQQLNVKQNHISKLEKLFKDLVKMKEPKNINDKGDINTERKIKIVSTKKIYKKSINKQERNQMINLSVLMKEKGSSRDVYHNQEEYNSVTNEISQEINEKDATNNVLLSNIYKKTFMHAQNDLKNSKLLKIENTKIPQAPNIMENYDRKCLVNEERNSEWHITGSKKSTNCNISKNSSNISKVLNEEKADSHIKDLTETYGFAIKMEDKVLLYDKDPRLRINLGSQIRKSNKFGCLRNDMLYENKIFREI